MAEAAGQPAAAMLAAKDLNAWYGESHILHGVDFEIQPGEVVTLLGRNGAGKTTTLKSIMGMVGRRAGSIAFEGRETVALPSSLPFAAPPMFALSSMSRSGWKLRSATRSPVSPPIVSAVWVFD